MPSAPVAKVDQHTPNADDELLDSHKGLSRLFVPISLSVCALAEVR
jgi:hypothetical protein